MHLPWGAPRHAGVLSVTGLLGAAPAGRDGAPAGDVVWVEEGTEWPEGLAFILRGIARAEAFAFPESRAAAVRDRAAAQPAGLALSAAHHRRLQDALRTRLPAGRGPAARLVRAALDAERPGPAGRWLLARLRRPLGCARLRTVTIVGEQPGVGRDLFAALGITAAHEAAGRGATADWALA